MLSICIPTYAGAARLERLLPSLIDVGDAELLVYDDGSPDKKAIRGALGHKAPLTFSLFENETNRGPIVAYNALARAASGDVVLLLDDDVQTPLGFFRVLRKLFDCLDDVGVLSWRSCAIDQRDLGAPGLLEPATELAGYCYAFRKSLWTALGGFDERFHVYCADSDFALRAYRAGHPCYRVWWPLVPHEGHAAAKASPELRCNEWVDKDLAAYQAKWGMTGQEMERQALASLKGTK